MIIVKLTLKLLLSFITIQVIEARVDCGFPGIDEYQCFQKNCVWDPVNIPVPGQPGKNQPWCYKPSIQDKEHSLGASEKQGLKNTYPIQLTNATVQFSGDCLFHCTAIPRQNRLSCSDVEVTVGSCLRGGCCYDQSETDITKRCFHSSPIVETCPAPQCQISDGRMELCYETNSVTPTVCAAIGCCAVTIGTQNLCYRKKAIAMRIMMPDINTEFLDSLKTQKADPEGFSVVDLLSKSKDQLIDQASTTTETTKLVITTTTEQPTTPRTTTPEPTTPVPVKKRICRWFTCRWVSVPAKIEQCYPSSCGLPRYYPGSPLTLPGASSSEQMDDFKKIVGGSRAYPFSHPWTAMFLKKEGDRTFVCGAAIICKHWLLTAAHCMNRQSLSSNIPDLDTRYYEVYVGRYMGAEYEPGKQVQSFIGHEGIDRIVIHEDFKTGVTRGIITHDIALIRLKQPIEFNNFVQPVCLPKLSTKENQILWATGWGDTRYQGPSNKNLKQLGVKVLNESVCNQQVTGFESSKPKGVICAGGEMGQDTCTGDSGGPLVGPKVENFGRTLRYRWELFGLTSIGSPSCNTRTVDRQPAIYTNVHYFKDWISEKTQDCCA